MSKLYSIVTNDTYEIPVKTDIVGARAVADYMGISLSYLRCMLCGAKPWPDKQKYKAVCMGEAGLWKKNHKLYYMRYDRTDYFKQYHKKRKEGRNAVDVH